MISFLKLFQVFKFAILVLYCKDIRYKLSPGLTVYVGEEAKLSFVPNPKIKRVAKNAILIFLNFSSPYLSLRLAI